MEKKDDRGASGKGDDRPTSGGVFFVFDEAHCRGELRFQLVKIQ